MKRFFIIALLLAILGGGSCRESRKKPSVILISLDTVRPDHLSLYGYFRKTTPFLEQLAKESVVFTNAYSPISLTVPSHASLFTSHYPSEHKLVNNGWRLENWKLPLLAEVLNKQGYQTAAVIGSKILIRYSELNRGFEYYQDRNFGYNISIVRSKKFQKRKSIKRLAQNVVDYGMDWLGKIKPGRPFFLFLHFYDAHMPYTFPQDWNKPFQNDADLKKYLEANSFLIKDDYDQVNDYDNSLSYLDQNLERFFRYLKEKNLLENTIIIIISDHGEGLGQHNFYNHWLNIYEEQVRVPLLIRFPRSEHAGRKVEAQVSLIDVAPTILDFLQVRDSMESRGSSLLPLITSAKSQIRPCNFQERRWFPEEPPPEEKHWAAGKKAGVVCGEWKLIWADREPVELYNLKSDPLELQNLRESEPKKYHELLPILQDHLEKINFNSAKEQAVPEKVRKTLKSLGYAQ